MSLELEGKSGFRLDPRWGKSGSEALGSKLSQEQRDKLIKCFGILTRQEAARAFEIHITSVDRIWKKAKQNATT